MNSLTVEYPWYSTPSREVAYVYTMTPFSKYFHAVDGEYVNTQFNLKTTTTRPSNKFNNVNYAALNKENGCRKSFIPRNNRFVEIDISAYHPSLSARLIDYDFAGVDIHKLILLPYIEWITKNRKNLPSSSSMEAFLIITKAWNSFKKSRNM